MTKSGTTAPLFVQDRQLLGQCDVSNSGCIFYFYFSWRALWFLTYGRAFVNNDHALFCVFTNVGLFRISRVNRVMKGRSRLFIFLKHVFTPCDSRGRVSPQGLICVVLERVIVCRGKKTLQRLTNNSSLNGAEPYNSFSLLFYSFP